MAVASGFLVLDRLKPILRRLAALEQTPDEPERPARFDPLAILPDTPPEPDWNLVRRHFRRYGNPRKTAEKYGLTVRELNAPTCIVPSCPADFVGQAGKVAEVLMRKAERLRANPDQPPENEVLAAFLARRWAVPIATTRMIAAGAAVNVRAAMADLEMWIG